MERVSKRLKKINGKRKFINVFDADGTLWSDDIADEFVLYLMNQSKSSNLINKEIWARYLEMIETQPVEACAYYMKLFEGISLERFVELVYKWWETAFEPKWVAPIKKLFCDLMDEGHDVVIISGSPRLLFLPLLDRFKKLQVFGMEFAMNDNQVFTGDYEGILSAGSGKREILLSLSRPVFVCAGNSHPDLPMLELSEIPIVVGDTDWHKDWFHPNKIIL